MGEAGLPTPQGFQPLSGATGVINGVHVSRRGWKVFGVALNLNLSHSSKASARLRIIYVHATSTQMFSDGLMDSTNKAPKAIRGEGSLPVSSYFPFYLPDMDYSFSLVALGVIMLIPA